MVEAMRAFPEGHNVIQIGLEAFENILKAGQQLQMDQGADSNAFAEVRPRPLMHGSVGMCGGARGRCSWLRRHGFRALTRAVAQLMEEAGAIDLIEGYQDDAASNEVYEKVAHILQQYFEVEEEEEEVPSAPLGGVDLHAAINEGGGEGNGDNGDEDDDDDDLVG